MGISCGLEKYEDLEEDLREHFAPEHTAGGDKYFVAMHDEDGKALVVPVVDGKVNVSELHAITVQCYLWGQADANADLAAKVAYYERSLAHLREVELLTERRLVTTMDQAHERQKNRYGDSDDDHTVNTCASALARIHLARRDINKIIDQVLAGTYKPTQQA